MLVITLLIKILNLIIGKENLMLAMDGVYQKKLTVILLQQKIIIKV